MGIGSYHHGDLKNALVSAALAILSEEGIEALSLRKVARRVGVSHAAPYAHFADKHALVAAIASDSLDRLTRTLSEAVERNGADPRAQLSEAAWAYARSAIEGPAGFKVTFSGLLGRGSDYPEYREASRRAFELVVRIAASCQTAGLLAGGPPEVAAVTVWGLVHGVVSLYLEGQISHDLLGRYTLRELIDRGLHQLVAGANRGRPGDRRPADGAPTRNRGGTAAGGATEPDGSPARRGSPRGRRRSDP